MFLKSFDTKAVKTLPVRLSLTIGVFCRNPKHEPANSNAYLDLAQSTLNRNTHLETSIGKIFAHITEQMFLRK